MRVPLFDAAREFQAQSADLLPAAERVLSSGTYVLGPEVEAFEREVSEYVGEEHAVACGSGTDALWLALRGLGIGPGDRVLTSPLTFFATASAIVNTGAEPVFADVDEGSGNISPDSVREALEDRSPALRRLGVRPETIKALVPVHLFGQPADMAPLLDLAREHGVSTVEDVAQALGAEYRGAKVGTFGDLGSFSFFPTKNLGGFGDGGMVTVRDDALAERVRMLRAHGANGKYRHGIVGTNSRLDELQAALLRVRFRSIGSLIDARRSHADAYDSALGGLDWLRIPTRDPDRLHTFHQYVVSIGDGMREGIREELSAAGVESAIHYPVPLHLQEALRGLGYQKGDFPIAEQLTAEVLSLPMFPTMRDDERAHVVDALSNARVRVPT